MENLSVCPVRTRIFRSGESLSGFVVESVPISCVRERMLLAVTSKIVSLSENRLVSREKIDKESLVRREADVFLAKVCHGCFLTVKDGLFIPSAGIDESNSETGDFILYPADPFSSAKELWRGLKEAWGLREMGILVTDSHVTPLRRGVTGVSLSHWGFEAVRKLVGTEDLFGRRLDMTNMNVADGLAASAVMMMGEGNEAQPLAVISNAPVIFCEESSPEETRMPLEEDLYYSFFKGVPGLK
ncbi:MAG: coenzyme F420-0:L-glutamate ligase [Pseudomonadota bacterium]